MQGKMGLVRLHSYSYYFHYHHVVEEV